MVWSGGRGRTSKTSKGMRRGVGQNIIKSSTAYASMPSSLLLVIRASFELMFCRVLLDIFDLIQRLDLLKGNPMLAEFDEIHLIADCIWNFQREASEVGSAQAFAWMFSAMLHIRSYGFGVFSPAYCTGRSIYSSLSIVRQSLVGLHDNENVPPPNFPINNER